MSLPRYPEYKDTGVEWIGKIPAHWDPAPLKRHVRLITDRATSSRRAIGLANVEGWSGRLIDTDGDFEGDGVAFEPGDVLFGKLRPYLAKVLAPDFPGEAVGDFHVLRPRGTLLPRYIQYQMLQSTFISVVDGSTFGSKMPRASWEALGGMLVMVPPSDEQAAIASFLDYETDKIDALIAEQEKLLALLAEKRQATISHAVTRGLDPNVPMKDSGIAWLGEVPAHWEITRLGVILDAIGDVDHFMPASVEQGVPYLMTGDLKEFVSEVSLEGCKQVSDEDYLALSRKIKSSKGDVIMARYATIGTSMYVDVDTDFLVSYSCVTLKANHSKVSGLYLFQYMRSDAFRQGVEGQVNTNTQGNVGINHLKNISVVLPPITEQAGIAAFVGSETARIDEMKAEAERAITLLRERRSALIAAAVTGKIDVRGAVEREAA